MKRLNVAMGIAALWCFAAPATAAPLFPDVPSEHWAKDALATLAAKGIVEGYPDGTFKGDRAASRWEAAMIVARVLAKMEQEHCTFATKAELAELNKLAHALKAELEALGVRVNKLEKETALINKRVTELERITFYGEFNAILGTQSMRNVGTSAMGVPAFLDYDSIVGSASGAGGIIQPPSIAAGINQNPFVTGIMSVVDWTKGQPMIKGSTITSKLTLGTRIKVTDDIDAGAEFAAYNSNGNPIDDAYWGVTAPAMCNPFASTVNYGNFMQNGSNTPYTRMVLDNFWIKHNPTNITLVAGAFKDENFDDMCYIPQINPGYYGDKYIDTVGIKLSGEHFNQRKSHGLRWEVMGARLPDGAESPVIPDANYATYTEGGNIEYLYDSERGSVKLNFLHTANEANNGDMRMAGLIQNINFTLNWVNPNGYYLNQLGYGTDQVAGIGSPTDVRPIAMVGAANNDGITGIPGVPNLGGIGPQEMNTYSGSAKYRFDCLASPRLYVDWGHTDYKPSKISTYEVGGSALRAGFGISLFDEKMDLDFFYLAVDPTYDPFLLQYPEVGGISNTRWRTPSFDYYNSLYSLHDTNTYPQNRRGVQGKVTWKFLPTGQMSFRYQDLEQVKTSMQDVRYSVNSIAPGTPNTTVLGFSPGFIEPVFNGFSPNTYVSDGTNALAIPLENPRGEATIWQLKAGYKYLLEPKKSARGVMISGGAIRSHFLRHSNLSSLVPGEAGIIGESQNNVDFYIDGWQAGVEYDVTNDFRINAGYHSVDIYGHLDPLGVMNPYAAYSGTTKFDIINIEQRIPELGIEWDLSDKTTFGLEGRFYYNKDRMNEEIFASPCIPAINVNYGPQSDAHPFKWQAWQLSGYLNMKF